MTCPKCSSEMLTRRHAGGWRSFCCQACFFVKIEEENKKPEESNSTEAPRTQMCG